MIEPSAAGLHHPTLCRKPIGQSEFALRFHAALFGTLTILVLYYLVRSVFDERVALITSILYAVYPLPP